MWRNKKGFCHPYLLNLSWVSLKEKFYRSKEKLWYSTFCWSCLVNQYWTFSFIGLMTWFDWKLHRDFQNSSQLSTFFLTLVLLRSLKQKEILKWNCFSFICCLPINFTLKNTFQFAWFMLRNRCVQTPITVQFEKIHNWHWWKTQYI